MFHILCTLGYTHVARVLQGYRAGMWVVCTTFMCAHVCCKKTKKRWVAVVAMGAVMCDV
jgi:hypothetical protein